MSTHFYCYYLNFITYNVKCITFISIMKSNRKMDSAHVFEYNISWFGCAKSTLSNCHYLSIFGTEHRVNAIIFSFNLSRSTVENSVSFDLTKFYGYVKYI